MRVLVTNTRSRQAYTTVVGLRAHAERIVAATSGPNRLAAYLTPTARSRLVDAVYRVPEVPGPWLAPAPTGAEERYVAALLAICRRERIDLIMPSRDEAVYILSRHLQRFERYGVAVPVCDFETTLRAMDKHQMLRVAERAGIPVPKTHRPRTRRELDDAIDDVGLPAVLKPRFGAGGRGLQWVMRRDQLGDLWYPPGGAHPDLLVQEYVRGAIPPNAIGVDVVMDRGGICRAMCAHVRWRAPLLNIGIPSSAVAVTDDPAPAEQTVRLLHALGWWGVANLDWKRDVRDGRLKLFESNARMGGTIWAPFAAGVNIPLILAQVTRGEAPPPTRARATRSIFVDPAIDCLSACTYLANRIGWLGLRLTNGRDPLPRDIAPPFKAWLRLAAVSCLARRRRAGVFWQALAKDPLPSILHWACEVPHIIRRRRDFLPAVRVAVPDQAAQPAPQAGVPIPLPNGTRGIG